MQCVKVGKLNLVDLAGSERVHITGATGKPALSQKGVRVPLHDAMPCLLQAWIMAYSCKVGDDGRLKCSTAGCPCTEVAKVATINPKQGW